jgi:hypothetical protein
MFNSVIEFLIFLRKVRFHDFQPGFVCTVFSAWNKSLSYEENST